MGKRLFEFAKELGLPSKEVLDRCKKLGFAIPSQLTVVDEKIQSDIRRDLGLADLVSAAASVAASGPAPLAAKPSGIRTPATTASSPVAATGASLKPTTGMSSPTATYPAPEGFYQAGPCARHGPAPLGRSQTHAAPFRRPWFSRRQAQGRLRLEG